MEEEDMAKELTIPVWTTELKEQTRAALPALARKAGEVVDVGADIITKNLNDFVQRFRSIVDIQDGELPFFVDEVELSLAVNAKGGIELLGKIEGGASASIKIKLKRRKP
jgi:hypothetical protein